MTISPFLEIAKSILPLRTFPYLISNVSLVNNQPNMPKLIYALILHSILVFKTKQYDQDTKPVFFVDF